MIVLPAVRGVGDRGVAVVSALVLLFAFTSGALVWLARDVDRVISNRSAAHSIAFQAARSGAQQVSVPSLRQGEVRINISAARSAAIRTAELLFEQWGVDGSVTVVRLNGIAEVVVELVIHDPVGDALGVASAEALAGP